MTNVIYLNPAMPQPAAHPAQTEKLSEELEQARLLLIKCNHELSTLLFELQSGSAQMDRSDADLLEGAVASVWIARP